MNGPSKLATIELEEAAKANALKVLFKDKNRRKPILVLFGSCKQLTTIVLFLIKQIAT